MNPVEPFLQKTRIAYFSMEIALRPEMHTYAGGLGVLAGDTARSAPGQPGRLCQPRHRCQGTAGDPA